MGCNYLSLPEIPASGIKVWYLHRLLARYVKLMVAHALGMPGTFFPPPTSKETIRSCTCVTHVLWCMSGSLILRWRSKRSRHSESMRNPQFCESGKRPIEYELCHCTCTCSSTIKYKVIYRHVMTAKLNIIVSNLFLYYIFPNMFDIYFIFLSLLL